MQCKLVHCGTVPNDMKFSQAAANIAKANLVSFGKEMCTVTQQTSIQYQIVIVVILFYPKLKIFFPGSIEHVSLLGR